MSKESSHYQTFTLVQDEPINDRLKLDQLYQVNLSGAWGLAGRFTIDSIIISVGVAVRYNNTCYVHVKNLFYGFFEQISNFMGI